MRKIRLYRDLIQPVASRFCVTTELVWATSLLHACLRRRCLKPPHDAVLSAGCSTQRRRFNSRLLRVRFVVVKSGTGISFVCHWPVASDQIAHYQIFDFLAGHRMRNSKLGNFGVFVLLRTLDVHICLHGIVTGETVVGTSA